MEAARVRANTILPAHNCQEMRRNITAWLWEGGPADIDEIRSLQESPESSPEGSGESDM